MEVHQHTHTPRKKWTHYFWEIFMLFLAVTAGFLVENQREHYIEHKREKQFIISLVNDIKADTARINRIIVARTERDRKLVTFSSLNNAATPLVNTNDLYFKAVTVSRTITIRFVPSDGIMQQLKFSGAFRLIRDREVADSIAKYDVTVRTLLRQGELEESLIHDYRQAAAILFNALVFYQMLDEDNVVNRALKDNPPLLPYDKSDLYIWNYKLYSMKALNT